jgi:hypothetical protein
MTLTTDGHHEMWARSRILTPYRRLKVDPLVLMLVTGCY